MTPAVEAMLRGDPNVPTAPLDEFLAAYAEDDNLWWRIGCGHHQNLFEAAVDLLEISGPPADNQTNHRTQGDK